MNQAFSKIWLVVVFNILIGGGVLAQSAETFPSPGLTPDSFFYFLDTLGEKIGMFFTFSAEKKAEKAIRYAEEKLAEVKAMAEKNKTQALEKANQRYQEFLGLANTKIKEAEEEGKDVEELAILITEKTLKHQEILVEVFEKVPEEAKTAIQKAIEVSRRGSEEAVQAVTGAKKEELLQKIEEILIIPVNWKIYRNEKYGYSFKYPPDCFYGPMPVYCKEKPPEERPPECLCFLDGENPDSIFLQAFTGEKDNLTLATFSVFHSDAPLHNPPPGTDLIKWLKEKFSPRSDEDIPDKPNTEIDGVPGVRVYLPGSYMAPSGERIYFIKNDKLFIISMIDVDSESNKELYNQILSTFKFIELEKAGGEAPKIEEVPKIEEKPTAPNTPMMLDIDVSTTAGAPYTISWRAVEEATNYILERDTNSSFSNPTIVSSRTLNSFSGTLSPSVSTMYYFRVKACNNYGCSFWSKITALWVEVSPSITVTSPNRGEKWIIGKTYDIKWSSTGLDKVTIDLFAYNSEGQAIKGFQYFIAKSIDAAKGYYNWTIPEIADYPNYKLRIYNKLCIGGDDLLAECLKDRYFDESDGYFSIISSTVWEALSACEKIRETSDIELRPWCVAMVKKDSFACEILSDPETYCYKDIALVTRDSVICEKIKDSGRRGACEALAERVPAKCSGWIYADYCYEEAAALTGDASICNLINYSGGKTDCKAVVLKDVSFCQNSDSEDCYQALALLTGDEKVCERLKERDDLKWTRDLNREVNKCIKMARREITGCSEVSGTGIDCDMIPVVTKNPSWCEKLEINRDRCYFYTAMRIADLLPLEFILLRN